MPLAVNETELHALLSQAPFLRGYGFQLQSIADGECTLAVPFREDLERPGGIVNGQVLMAAADVAMWFAIMTRLGQSDGSSHHHLHPPVDSRELHIFPGAA